LDIVEIQQYSLIYASQAKLSATQSLQEERWLSTRILSRISSKQFPRHDDLGKLEKDVVGIANNLGADLDQFLPRQRHRSVPHTLR